MNQNVTHFFVGSTNPVKINSVRQAIQEKWPNAVVTGYAVASNVSSQPSSDQETLQGATNRSRAAMKAGLEQYPDADPEFCLGVGLEGGVTDWNDEMWSTVWVSVVDYTGEMYSGNGARVKVPTVVADLIKSGGEMGPMMVKLTGQSDVRQGQGMFGVITDGFVNRTEEYSAIAKFVIGLWYGRDWQEKL